MGSCSVISTLDQTLSTILLVSRSVGDQRTVNAHVVGSIPTLPAIYGDCDVIRSIIDCESM